MKNSNSKKDQQNCQICYEKFTTKRRHSIKCIHCNNSVCLQCFRTYLLSDDSEQVCMCCKEGVSTEFIYLHTPKKFQQDFLTKVTTLEMVREKALLVDTEEQMDFMERRDLLQSRIHYLNKHLHFFPKDYKIRCIYDDAEKECEKLESLLREKKSGSVEKVITSFICPVVNCDGIVIGGKCSYCKNIICVKCHAQKLDDPDVDSAVIEGHKCDPGVLATMNLLKKDTKQCPKCKIPIHKVDGCDQMFCIKCKTAFSWKTGKIETGIMHNPHYFEWMRNRGPLPRQPGDNPCDLEFDVAFEELFMRGERDELGKSPVTLKNITYTSMISCNFIPRVIREVRLILPRLAETVHNAELINREKDDLRKKYIIQKKKLKQEDQEDKIKIENNWFQQLKLMFKKREMKKDIIKLLEIFERCMKDSIIMAFRTGDFEIMFETILSVLSYVQVQLEENEKRHGIKNKTSLSIYHGISCKLIRW